MLVDLINQIEQDEKRVMIVMNIDFIITWVNDNNDEWVESKERYLHEAGQKSDTRKNRFRNWNNLRYFFRGVDECAPWVHRVYLVTPGYYPEWLNCGYDKVRVINQDDIMPEGCTPTFNNVAIELNMHRIPELSEHFVYFCDDMFLIDRCTENDFFRNGKPCDRVGFRPIPAVYENGKGLYGSMAASFRIAARSFTKSDVIKNAHGKFFDPRNGKNLVSTVLALPYGNLIGFTREHVAYSYTKSVFEEVWKSAGDELIDTCRCRYREEFNVVHWAMRYWQICSGNYEVRSGKFGRMFAVKTTDDAVRVSRKIDRRSYKMVCVNDDVYDEEFDSVKCIINNSFDRRFPNKSSFEL